MKALVIKEGVYWVGARDPKLRVFDIVMETEYGTTYNSYLVVGTEKSALIETVKSAFFEEMLENIREVMDPAKLDYIVVNHTEPDHTGSLGKLLQVAPGARVLGSKVALKFLRAMLNADFTSTPVEGGESIDLGGKTLQFISAPFLHWPDSMFTYLPQDKVLFPCDAFGSHYSSTEMYNDKVGDISKAFKYYYDVIVSPFKKYVLEAVDKVKDLEIDVIAPSHGPILRDNPHKYVESYVNWSTEPARQGKKVAVIYASAYGYTGRLAEKIVAGIRENDIQAEIYELGKTDLPSLVEAIEKSDGIVIGSPTINRDAVPPIWELLARVCVITNKNKPAAAFGSYGWSGEAVKLIEQRLTGLQLKVPVPGFRVNFVPSEEDLDNARQFGKEFAMAVKPE